MEGNSKNWTDESLIASIVMQKYKREQHMMIMQRRGNVEQVNGLYVLRSLVHSHKQEEN